MTTLRTAIVLAGFLLACGCSVRSPSWPTLDDGFYTMDSSIEKTGVARDYGGSSRYKVTVDDTEIRLEPMEGATNVWFEGTLKEQQIVLTVEHLDPDPMLEAMKLNLIFEGQVTADGFAEGTVTGSAGTNVYLTGTWRLSKLK